MILNPQLTGLLWPTALNRMVLTMKLIILFLLLNIATAFGGGFAQNITLKAKSMPLLEAMRSIKKQSGYGYFLKGKDLAHLRLDASIHDMPLDKAMVELLKNAPADWFLEDGIIVIRSSPQKLSVLKADQVIAVQETPDLKRRINGKVSDADGNPLAGVSVVEKGTKNGTTTDQNGRYVMTVDENAEVLEFSMVGFNPLTEKIKGKTVINVVLSLKDDGMDEVVINGLFTQNKNSYTGAVTTLSGKEILEVSQTNLLKAIEILTPGLRLVEQNEMGSDPNHIPEIVIRGMSSIASQGEYGLNTPLIILDGVEISMVQLYDLDIHEIERIDILKDASATSMYGEKAANGVIVIERKRVTDRNVRVRYNLVPSFEFPDIKSYTYTDATQKLELERLAGLYNSSDGSLDADYNEKYKRIQRGANTNWMAKPLRNSLSLNHSLSMTGRGGGMDYGVTVRYTDRRGVMKDDYRDSYGLGFYFSYRLVNKLTLTYRADINKTDTKNSPYGSFSEYVKLNPYDVPFNSYGEWNKILSYSMRNPLYDATTSSFNELESKYITNSVSLRWDIANGLYSTGSFNYTLSDSKSENFVSPQHSSFENETDPGQRGRYNVSSSDAKNWQARVGLTYIKHFGSDGSILTFNAGTSASRNNSNSYNFAGIGFLNGNLTDLAFANSYPLNGRPGGSESLNASVSAYGNLNMIFGNRYFFDASYRVSGASKFGRDRRFAPFWSAGIGWNAHNESFIKDLGVFDIFRVRGSLGYTGSVNFSDYQAITTYRYSQDNNYLISMGALPITMGNDELKWQTTIKTNVGTTIEMLKGRLSANLDFYVENTHDLLLSISTPPSVGVTNVMGNLGETGNWGYEWALSGMVIKKRGLYWRIGFSGYHNQNKIKKISNSLKRQNDEAMKNSGVAAPKLQLEEGQSMTAIYAVRSLGIDPATGREVFIKKDGTYSFDYDVKDKIALGNSVPAFQGAFRTSAGYKGFSVSAAISFIYGKDVYNTTRASKVERINPRENVDVRAFTERWKKPGDIVHYTGLMDSRSFVHSQRFIERQNELYLSSLNLAYEINSKWLNKVGMKRLRVGIGFTEILRLTTVKYERGTTYPYSKGYNFTISPTF